MFGFKRKARIKSRGSIFKRVKKMKRGLTARKREMNFLNGPSTKNPFS